MTVRPRASPGMTVKALEAPLESPLVFSALAQGGGDRARIGAGRSRPCCLHQRLGQSNAPGCAPSFARGQCRTYRLARCAAAAARLAGRRVDREFKLYGHAGRHGFEAAHEVWPPPLASCERAGGERRGLSRIVVHGHDRQHLALMCRATKAKWRPNRARCSALLTATVSRHRIWS